MEWGSLNDLLATNWDQYHDCTDTTYFFAKATLRQSETLKVMSWEVVTGPSYDSHSTDDWPVGSERPAFAVYLLGSVQFADGTFVAIQNSGGGSLVLSEHITHISPGTGLGDVEYGKQLVFSRQTY